MITQDINLSSSLSGSASKKSLSFIFLAFIFALSACTSNPVVDMDGVDPAQYQKDLAECEAYQDQVESAVPKRAIGAALVGGLIGAIYGNAAQSAGAGAIAGGASGVYDDGNTKDRVVRRCLAKRGYTIYD